MTKMKGFSPKIRIVLVQPLSAHHVEALKELVRRAALRKLRASIRKYGSGIFFVLKETTPMATYSELP